MCYFDDKYESGEMGMMLEIIFSLASRREMYSRALQNADSGIRTIVLLTVFCHKMK